MLSLSTSCKSTYLKPDTILVVELKPGTASADISKGINLLRSLGLTRNTHLMYDSQDTGGRMQGKNTPIPEAVKYRIYDLSPIHAVGII